MYSKKIWIVDQRKITTENLIKIVEFDLKNNYFELQQGISATVIVRVKKEQV